MYTKGRYRKKQAAAGPQSKSGRGSVSRNWRIARRRRDEPEFRERKRQEKCRWYRKNREKQIEKERNRRRELSEFRNKHCRHCGKLLEFRTKGNFCYKHWRLKRKDIQKRK